MSILPWPKQPRPSARANRRAPHPDPLPRSILHAMVADIPGPRGETEDERAARFQRQLADVLSYKPRDAAELMMAVQCVVMRLLQADSARDAARADAGSELAKQARRQAGDFAVLAQEMAAALARFQARPLTGPAAGILSALGKPPSRERVSDEPAFAEKPAGASIAALHPAPAAIQ